MKSTNKLGLIFSVVAAISVFLPWAESSSSYSAGSFGSGSYSSGGISGISLGVGLVGLAFAIAAAIMSYKSKKATWIIGLVMFIDALYYLFSMSNAGGSSTTSFGEYSASASVKVQPQLGLFLFAISSLLILITTLKDRKN